MAGREQEYRVFVGGLSGDVTQHQLEDAFSRFGKVIDAQVLMEKETGRPRGFGFLTYADRRSMDDAIREMHGIEFGDRVISVNRAKPRQGGADDPGYGYGGGGYSSGGRGVNYGGDRSIGQDECFKCGRSGHWARDCPSAGGGRGGGEFSHPRFGGRFGDRDRFIDDRYDGGRYGDRDRYDSFRDNKYGPRDRYVSERYPPPIVDRFGGDRYTDRYPANGYGKERDYDRDRRSSDRYGVGGPARGKSYRDRAAAPGPYDRPRRGGGRMSSFDRY